MAEARPQENCDVQCKPQLYETLTTFPVKEKYPGGVSVIQNDLMPEARRTRAKAIG